MKRAKLIADTFRAAWNGKLGDVRIEWGIIFATGYKIVKDVTSNPGQERPMFADVLRFAALCTDFEIKAEGKTFEDTIESPAVAARWMRRFAEWAQARAKMHELIGKKSIPEHYSYTGDYGDAAFNGWLLKHDGASAGDEKLLKFLQHFNSQDKRNQEIFADYASGKRKGAAWNHPVLDAWLICIWPLVDKYRWTYRDVWKVATEKFQEGSGGPYETAKCMKSHCKEIGLVTQNKTTGRVKRVLEPQLPEMGKLALLIQPGM